MRKSTVLSLPLYLVFAVALGIIRYQESFVKCLNDTIPTGVCTALHNLDIVPSALSIIYLIKWNSTYETTMQENSCLKLPQISNQLCCLKNEQHFNTDQNFDHQMSLSKSKCLYSNNCLRFLKHAVPLYQENKSEAQLFGSCFC